VNYNDGAWDNCPGNWASCYTVLPTSSPWSFAEPGTGPAFTRAQENDDHNFKGSIGVTLAASPIVNGDLNFGPLDAQLSVKGTLSGSASVDHILQDALISEQDPNLSGGQTTPVSALTVRPHTSASLNWGNPVTGDPALGVYATFTINPPFIGPLSWTQTLATVPEFTVASFDSDSDSASPTGRAWPESGNMRIGTWSPVGSDVTNQPTVDSQLPGSGGTFQSFPSGHSVSACLSDTTPGNAAPPACPAPPAQGAAPSTNLCAYTYATSGPQNLPLPSACGNITAWAQDLAAQASPYLSATDANLISYLNALCAPTSTEDSLGRVSHVLAGNDLYNISTSINAVLWDMGKTAQAGGAIAAIAHADATNWVQRNFLFGPCDSHANLLAPSQVLAPVSSTSVPSVSSGGTCN
jgi:hypothetical protein